MRSRYILQSILLLFVFLNAASFTRAQTGNLKGSVSTSNGKVAPYVNILIKESARGTVSSETGTYTLTGIKPGDYTVVISFTGLKTIEQPVRITSGETTVRDFTLEETARQLQEVIVKAKRGMNDVPASAGKISIAPRDLPQSIQVIDKKILDRQQVLRLSDALQNVTGVYLMGNTGGYQEEIAARGYAFGSNNTFKNGARFNNGAMPEMSGVEKVEFLKGGSAILFGNVAAGGIMNIVTKKPKFENGGEISFRAGSYDFYKPSLDIYGAFNNNNKAAYRVNTTFEKANSFRDHVSAERFYINPSFLFKLGNKTDLLVEGDYLKDTRTADFGIGAVNYETADVGRGRFLGVDWGYNKAEQTTTTATVTHHLNAAWQIRGMYSFQKYDVDLFGAARPTSIQTDGTWIRGLQKSSTSENYNIAQVDLNGKFTTGKIAHTLLFGADWDNYSTVANTYNTTSYNNDLSNNNIKGKNIYDTINIYNTGNYKHRFDLPYLPVERITTSPVERYGIYIQDLVAITNNVKLLAGARYSNQYNKMATVDSVLKNTQGTIASSRSGAISPRVGIVYQPVRSISLFASYTNNFSVNSGWDIYGNPLKPSIINQYEAGVKTDIFRELLSANLTLYRIVNDNFAQTALVLADGTPNGNKTIKELAGEVTSKGVEIELATRSVNGFIFMAGYSYNDTRYTKSNTYKINDRLRYNPAHTANASVYYAFSGKSLLKGFNIGAGAYYVGDRVAGRNTTAANPNYKLISLPDYFLFDASAGYAMNNFSVRVKLTNLLNELSYNVHDDNSVNPIAPRQVAATFAYRF
jgi:iron complex outermembrane receptor protein